MIKKYMNCFSFLCYHYYVMIFSHKKQGHLHTLLTMRFSHNMEWAKGTIIPNKCILGQRIFVSSCILLPGSVVCWLAELCHILLFRDFNAAIVNTFNDVMGVLSLDRAPNTLKIIKLIPILEKNYFKQTFKLSHAYILYSLIVQILSRSKLP